MTGDGAERSIRVHSDPHDEWFGTEVEVITDGLLAERNTAMENEFIPSQVLALTRLAVRVVARRGEPFTAADIWQVIERREIPMPAGTTPGNVEVVWRRLSRRIDQSDAARGPTGGQP
jgi:hypothetical protein